MSVGDNNVHDVSVSPGVYSVMCDHANNACYLGLPYGVSQTIVATQQPAVAVLLQTASLTLQCNGH